MTSQNDEELFTLTLLFNPLIHFEIRVSGYESCCIYMVGQQTVFFSVFNVYVLAQSPFVSLYTGERIPLSPIHYSKCSFTLSPFHVHIFVLNITLSHPRDPPIQVIPPLPVIPNTPILPYLSSTFSPHSLLIIPLQPSNS